MRGVRQHHWLSTLGNLLYYLFPVKREVIETNISQVYGDQLAPKEVKHLVKAVYGNLFWLGGGVLWNCLLPRWWRARAVEVRYPEHLHKPFSEGKGVLWLSAHLGNWEVAIVNLMAREERLRGKTTVIRKRIRPPWMCRLVMGRYRRAGIDILSPVGSSLKTVVKKLRRNEGVVFVMDQHMSAESATTAKFFGHGVQFSKALAGLAIRTGAPVVPIYAYRGRWGRHICEVGEPIAVADGENLEDRIQKTTEAFSRSLEKVVSEHPEEWFCWTHRLWKTSVAYSEPGRS